MNPFTGPLNRKGFLLWSIIAYVPVIFLTFIIRANSTDNPSIYRTEALISIYFLTILIGFTYFRRLQDFGAQTLVAVIITLIVLLAPLPFPEIYVFLPVWLILLFLPSRS